MHRVLCENSRMFKIRVILFLLIIVCGRARALDEFEGGKCEADIPKSLVGKRYKNERVVVLEELRKDLGLKDLGGIEISDRLFLISWQICGSEYELLLNTKSRLIRDVLPFPAHSSATQKRSINCQVLLVTSLLVDVKIGPKPLLRERHLSGNRTWGSATSV